jgi:hypothetical protein
MHVQLDFIAQLEPIIQ